MSGNRSERVALAEAVIARIELIETRCKMARARKSVELHVDLADVELLAGYALAAARVSLELRQKEKP
jgi:hypothetical protein